MSVRAQILLVGVTLVAAIAAPAAAARADSVTTSGSVTTEPGYLGRGYRVSYRDVTIDARSGPNGPSGTVAYTLDLYGSGGGPVTRLEVNGERARIGFNDTGSGSRPQLIEVVDNGPGGPLISIHSLIWAPSGASLARGCVWSRATSPLTTPTSTRRRH